MCGVQKVPSPQKFSPTRVSAELGAGGGAASPCPSPCAAAPGATAPARRGGSGSGGSRAAAAPVSNMMPFVGALWAGGERLQQHFPTHVQPRTAKGVSATPHGAWGTIP